MSSFHEFTFKEIYFTGPDETVSSSGPIRAFHALEDLLIYLKSKNLSVSPDIRVLHGFLTPAEVIPKDIDGCQIFIIFEDPKKPNTGMIQDADCEDYEELGEEVEDLLDKEAVASSFAEISDVYILYGYEIGVVMTVDEEDLDDGKTKLAESIAHAARKIYERSDLNE